MMLKFLSLLCLMALCHSFPSASDEMIDEIFGPSVETTPQTSRWTTPSTTQATTAPEEEVKPEEKEEPEKKELEENDYVKCSKSDGKPRLCVPYYLCAYEGLEETTHSLTDELPLNIRMPIDTDCSSYMEICCDEKYISKEINRRTKPWA